MIRIFFILTIALLTACGQTNNINHDKVAIIELVQVDNPYIGEKVDTKKLDMKFEEDFLTDLADKAEWVSKFYSCYVIKIHLKDGQAISYRTNGLLFEKLKDNNTTAIYFKLNKNINLLTKYWGIQQDKFCDSIKRKKEITVADLKGSWYLNKWTAYHTLIFSDNTVFVDNNIDTVSTLNYSLMQDTLITWTTSNRKFKNKIISYTKHNLILDGILENTGTCIYSRTKTKPK